MKKLVNNSLKTLIVFFSVIFLGFAFLYISHLLPSGKIAEHVRESGSIIRDETDYWVMTHGDNTSQLDNFTDAIMLLSSGYTGSESLMEKTIFNYRIYMKGATKGESCLYCGILGANQMKRHSYEWYWQGFQIVLKPLLLFLNLTQIRHLNMFVVLTSIVTICLLLQRQNKTAYILPYVTSICFLNLSTIFVSLQYSTIFHLTSLGMILMLLYYNNIRFQSHLWLFFMVFGMMTSYFDFLTYPIMVLGFLLILYFLLNESENLGLIGKAIGYSAIWFVGYIGMWASKWILSSIITGENQITKGISKFQERSSNTVGDATFTWSEMMNEMKSYLENGFTIYLILISILVLTLLIIVTKGYKNTKKWIHSFIIGGISLYPFVWYTIAANHSMQHAFFTFKSMSVFVFGASAFLIPIVDWKLLKQKFNLRF